MKEDRMRRTLTRVLVGGGLLAAAAVMFAGSAAANARPSTVFVSHGSQGCGHPHLASINAAVAAVAKGGTVVVCRGTYNEDVVVTKPLRLVGHHARINPSSPVMRTNSPLYAQTGNNAVTIAAPWVTVRGVTAVGATGDGIFSFANHSRIIGNWASGNAATGIDLNGSSWSLVKGNVTERNTGGGITLANDAGGFIPGATASHDWIVGNVSADNPLGCGVILADHLGSTVSGARGIFANVIQGNVLKHNGDGSTTPEGAGAGVVLASPVPGGAVYGNLVVGNRITASGLAGVTIHSHLPGQRFGGNRVIGNLIGTNNVTGDFGDPFTTGVYVGSVDPLTIVVRHNVIRNNHFGIFTAGAVTVRARGNVYLHVPHHRGSTSPYAG
jgi:parallel beta-helix repeat protein